MVSHLDWKHFLETKKHYLSPELIVDDCVPVCHLPILRLQLVILLHCNCKPCSHLCCQKNTVGSPRMRSLLGSNSSDQMHQALAAHREDACMRVFPAELRCPEPCLVFSGGASKMVCVTARPLASHFPRLFHVRESEMTEHKHRCYFGS